MRRLVPVAAAAALLALPGGAGAAKPLKPFGHPCQDQDGVRFCETKNDVQRVPSFDGVPIDVDVTLPATGNGPFPTLVLMHGYGGSKSGFESSDPVGSGVTYHYNNNFFARQGYAVVTPSARGFGRSCGAADSRTSPGCDRGWIHFADQRYELHDVQYLLGLLADEGVTIPTRIGVSGISYGGLQSAELAFMANRVRLRNGAFVPWRSPKGKPMRIAASWVRWASGELAYSLIPNGRLLSTDWRVPDRPFGVEKESLLNILYLGGAATGYIAPPGADPTADLATWRARANQGEPYDASARAFLDQFRRFKGAFRLKGDSVPLMIQNGWTDPVFPAQDALRLYNRARDGRRNAPVVLQVGDIGHFTGGEAPAQYTRFDDDGVDFLAAHVMGTGSGILPGSVTVFGQGCPKGQLGLGPMRARAWGALARGSFRLRLDGAHTVKPHASDATDAAIDPVSHQDRCPRVAATRTPGSAVLARTSRGFTMVGLPAVQATVKTTGRFGQVDARLWDVAPGGKQRIVDYGVYRLAPSQTGRVAFQLFGNAYRFPRGHRIKLELTGSSAPLFRASNGKFHVVLSHVRASLPARERPSKSRAISKPTKLR